MVPEDHAHAAALSAHRTALDAVGGGDLAPRPWQAPGQPASDCDLVRLAAHRAASESVGPEVVIAGLGLIDAARAELDQAEAGLLFAARAAGMTFQQIAVALGLGSGQAAQQRMTRVVSRSGSDS